MVAIIFTVLYLLSVVLTWFISRKYYISLKREPTWFDTMFMLIPVVNIALLIEHGVELNMSFKLNLLKKIFMIK